MTTLTNNFENEVLKDLENGRKKSNEEVQKGARMLIERWKKQLEN